MWNRRNRWLRRLATGIAFAAVAAPAAQARIAIDSGVAPSTVAASARHGGSGHGGPGDGSYVQGYAGGPLVAYSYQHGKGAITRPDDRAARVSPQAGDQRLVVRPDDRATRVVPTSNAGPQLVALPSTSDGFNWGDAGIGAAAALCLMLLGLGAGRMTRHIGPGAPAGA